MPEVFHVPAAGADALWIDGIFLGWPQTRPPCSTMYFSSPEDSAAIIGPPRSGKTGGVLMPAAMTWPGSLISASTKTDVLRATRGRRLDVAVLRGGDVYLYAPAERGEVTDGVRHMRWSPLAGCEDPATCEERVAKIIGPRRKDQDEDEFFRQQAAIVLRGYFHAAALGGYGMRRVKRWVDENSVKEPIEILRGVAHKVPSADAYLSSLRGIDKQAPATKSSTFSTVTGKLGPLVNNAVVLENLDRPNFDIDNFLTFGSTLYIVSPENVQEIIAPLITGLVEAIVTRAYAFAARQSNGRMDPPLLLLLDEVGAIAPLPTLPQIMAQGASQGILCAWAAQSFSQLKAKWGQDWASAILGSSAHKLIFGGASADTELLNQFSEVYGERDQWISPYGQGSGAMLRQIVALAAGQSQSPVHSKEKILKVSDLHQQSRGRATLLAATPAGPQFVVVDVPHVATVEPFRQIILAEQAVQSKLQGREGEPQELRTQAIIHVLFQAMPAAEQERFRREEAKLIARLQEFEALPREAQLAKMSKDPAWSREVRSSRTVAAQSPADRMESHCRIIEAFRNGGIPHFTFTVIPAAPEPGRARPTVHRVARWSDKR
jgi:type IV secretion system protein VirD4